jgi:cell division protein FtsZ
MITYPRYLARQSEPQSLLIGLGNAGINIMDRLISQAGFPMESLAINTDQQSISNTLASKKISMGQMTTHGLGTGGDPEIGLDAAKESAGEIQRAIAGANIIFICAGLGGGTGSGAAPLLAEMAKQNGSLVIAVVTSPFSFEGRRRSQQAAASLRDITRFADAILHFENDRMSELIEPHAEVRETFAICDNLLFRSISSLNRIVTSTGPIPVSLPDMLTVLRHSDDTCLFGCGEANGENRGHHALESALRSPLLDRGRLLHDAGRLLVHISGPPSLSMEEVSEIMREISNNLSPSAMLNLGVSATHDHSSPLTVAIIGRCGTAKRTSVPAKVTPDLAALTQSQPTVPPASKPEQTEAPFFEMPVAHTAHPPEKAPAPKVQQPLLPLDPVTRGRFDKIEPTIVEGQDLDVPTFLRMKLKK